MIAKVRLTYTVDVFVKGDSEDQIMDWAREHTPSEAADDVAKRGKTVNESWDEEIMAWVDGYPDIDISEEV